MMGRAASGPSVGTQVGAGNRDCCTISSSVIVGRCGRELAPVCRVHANGHRSKSIAAPMTVLWLVLAPCDLAAQDWRAQAQQSPDALGSVTDLIDQQTMEATVTPYETDAPPEAGIAPHQIEDEVFNARVSDSVAARGLSAQVDSALTRPDVDLGDNPLGLADAAVGASEAVAGGLFVPGGEACDASLTATPRDEVLYCTAVASAQYQTCRETRSIEIDRDDLWACSTEDLDYKKRCSQAVSWTCTGETGTLCTQAALGLPASAVWLAGATGFDMSGTLSTDVACTLQFDSFTVTATDAIDLRSLVVDQVTFNGAAQIRVNGVNVWTFGTSATGNLNIRNRDCGKDCSRGAAYAGDTWIEDCGSTNRTTSPNVDLLSSLPGTSRGPSSIIDHAVVLAGPTQATWTIELIRINRTETAVGIGVAVAGSCCSAWSADTGGACP